jgi:hypothetical protein
VSDPGKQQNGEGEEQKEIERVWKPIAPALNPIEHSRHKTFSFRHVPHGSTEVLAQLEAVKKKMTATSNNLEAIPREPSS